MFKKKFTHAKSYHARGHGVSDLLKRVDAMRQTIQSYLTIINGLEQTSKEFDAAENEYKRRLEIYKASTTKTKAEYDALMVLYNNVANNEEKKASIKQTISEYKNKIDLLESEISKITGTAPSDQSSGSRDQGSPESGLSKDALAGIIVSAILSGISAAFYFWIKTPSGAAFCSRVVLQTEAFGNVIGNGIDAIIDYTHLRPWVDQFKSWQCKLLAQSNNSFVKEFADGYDNQVDLAQIDGKCAFVRDTLNTLQADGGEAAQMFEKFNKTVVSTETISRFESIIGERAMSLNNTTMQVTEFMKSLSHEDFVKLNEFVAISSTYKNVSALVSTGDIRAVESVIGIEMDGKDIIESLRDGADKMTTINALENGSRKMIVKMSESKGVDPEAFKKALTNESIFNASNNMSGSMKVPLGNLPEIKGTYLAVVQTSLDTTKLDAVFASTATDVSISSKVLDAVTGKSPISNETKGAFENLLEEDERNEKGIDAELEPLPEIKGGFMGLGITTGFGIPTKRKFPMNYRDTFSYKKRTIHGGEIVATEPWGFYSGPRFIDIFYPEGTGGTWPFNEFLFENNDSDCYTIAAYMNPNMPDTDRSLTPAQILKNSVKEHPDTWAQFMAPYIKICTSYENLRNYVLNELNTFRTDRPGYERAWKRDIIMKMSNGGSAILTNNGDKIAGAAFVLAKLLVSVKLYIASHKDDNFPAQSDYFDSLNPYNPQYNDIFARWMTKLCITFAYNETVTCTPEGVYLTSIPPIPPPPENMPEWMKTLTLAVLSVTVFAVSTTVGGEAGMYAAMVALPFINQTVAPRLK